MTENYEIRVPQVSRCKDATDNMAECAKERSHRIMPCTNRIKVSIVIPCYEGENYIEKSIREAEREFVHFIDCFEIIVVVDGIVDKTFEIVSRLADEYGNIRIFGYDRNRGKGFAVRYGIEKAGGEYAFMMDSDLDYKPAILKEFLTIAEATGADIVCGNRRDANSIFIYPALRKVSSYLFNSFVNFMFRHLDIPDTQAGVKLFRSETTRRKLLPELKRYGESDGFVFDVCALVLARRGNLRIVTAPCIFEMRTSTIGVGRSFFSTSSTMLKEVFTFKSSLKWS
jgi:glycosyltransferase involved in cell wall biosynthesis